MAGLSRGNVFSFVIGICVGFIVIPIFWQESSSPLSDAIRKMDEYINAVKVVQRLDTLPQKSDSLNERDDTNPVNSMRDAQNNG